MDNYPKHVPSVKEFRHKAEIPLLALGVLLTTAVTFGALYVVLRGDTLSSFAEGVVFGLATPLIVSFFIRYHYWNTISSAIEVTERQFPEIHSIYIEIAHAMGFHHDASGLRKLPRLYITNGNGKMNAFASKCQLHRGYVVLFSDLVDIAYTHGDFKTLRFILAHELAHIRCGHVNLWRTIITPVTTALFLDRSVTRAQEYTADRVACFYAPGDYKGMISLYAGKHLGKHVDLDEYFRSIDSHKNGFWLRVANFFSTHAVGYRRMKTLRETDLKGWNIHGKML
ncbi:M48 family metallopeptidase [Corynebacterium freiburgense]|uniref:M48 family metallopeptidase n=1 Tax=Corynebacterium freiburgense TaxID=556548 RepID=UPI0004042D18|nr:M48 family metallopeptidase [Corynebacterium freiburgense]WJZ03767.1 M48 family peptidase [Corynebacterium freiburgense]